MIEKEVLTVVGKKEEEKKRKMQEMRDGSLTDHVVVGVDDIRLYASDDENGVLVPYLSVFLDTKNIVGIFSMDSPYKKSKMRDIINGLELIEEEETGDDRKYSN